MGSEFKCEICNRGFGSKEAIDSHNRAKHASSHKLKSKTFPIKTIAIIAILLVVIVGVTAYSILGHKQPTTNTATNTINTQTSPQLSEENVQTATLRVSGASYILEPSTFKKDVPVKIVADINRMPGCSKVVTIPDFNIFKSVSNQDNTITFIPTKTGTFTMACTMNMYRTTFTVE